MYFHVKPQENDETLLFSYVLREQHNVGYTCWVSRSHTVIVTPFYYYACH